jgi:hypothetical protein
MAVGILEKVPLHSIWKNEARDFTSWLAENLDFLGETIGLTLSLVQQEAPAGPFFADILAEDKAGHLVVIENQLETTDHDHLGKLVTYLSNLDAKVAVWICKEPRPEHETAVRWLNEASPADTAFYLLRLEAYRIGDSPAAPKLTLVAAPSEEAKEIGDQKKEMARGHALRLQFWQQLLKKAKETTVLHANVSPGTGGWVSTGAGYSGLTYAYVVRMNDAQVEFYIDKPDAKENKAIFDALLARKTEIEAAFGEPLEWQRLDESRACRIRHVLHVGGLQDEPGWPRVQEAMIEAMTRLEKAIKPQLKQVMETKRGPKGMEPGSGISTVEAEC